MVRGQRAECRTGGRREARQSTLSRVRQVRVSGRHIHPSPLLRNLEGLPDERTKAPYKTTFYGLYDRAHSFDLAPPFDLPARYREKIGKLDLARPFDFVSTCDVVGGQLRLAGDQ